MSKRLRTVMLSLGSGAIVGGVFAYHFGLRLQEPLHFRGLGFNTTWNPYDYCFLGAVLAAIGTVCAVAALCDLLCRRPPIPGA